MSNINDTYFDGLYKQIWKTVIPEELTQKEVDFILQYFKLQPDNSVLDLMCGYGRHALALAAKGINVTAVDNLADYINEINKNRRTSNVTIKTVLSDVIEYVPDEKFDLIICMGNSLQFFKKNAVMKLLKNVSAHLNSGGHFLINTWSILEIVAKNFKEKSWSNIGDFKFLVDSKYLFSPNRIEMEHQIIATDGKTEVKQSVDYIWSLNELEDMMSEFGIKMKEVFSVPGKKKFTIGEPRAYIIAEKR